MTSKLFFNLGALRPASKLLRAGLIPAGLLLLTLGVAPQAVAGDAPRWMHALVNASLPAHDEKTDAVQLYSEQIVTVVSPDKIKTVVREAYKILRPDGREYGTVFVSFNASSKVTGMRGWCIPAQGKDYEIKDKEAFEIALPQIEGSELISDVKDKVLRIPAADPGNIVGYEFEVEEQPYVLQDVWYFQGRSPVREAHYTLRLPSGWEYKATWLNYPEVKATQSGGNQWEWVVTDVKALKYEEEMPPRRGVGAQMFVNFYPRGGGPQDKSFQDWRQMGIWYTQLTRGRRDASPEIKQKVAALTASAPTPAAKMKAIATFLQLDVRYVAVELGIGGWQPHSAAEVLSHRYGDCKDKATLMSSMLKEVDVDSYYVAINSARGSVSPAFPAYMGAFDHTIIAIKLPEGLSDGSLMATLQHPKLGKLLFFDPTNELTPFGQIAGYLQENYGLLVAPDGGELVELPKLPSAMNGVERSGKLALNTDGTLSGEVHEVRVGDNARWEREALLSTAKGPDPIKTIETLLSQSLSAFRITRASVLNLQQTDQPLRFEYSFVASNYTNKAGNLLLVRPRVIGSKSSALLETKEPRQFPVIFDGPTRDTDDFQITLPPGYEVDDLPLPVNLDYSFASYHSKAEVNENVLHYSRTFELRELSVPLSKIEELKKFYRYIASDERDTAVLKPAGSH